MAQEGQSRKPNIMPFHACRGEFQGSLRRENQNRTIELTLGTGSLGERVVVLDIQNGLNGNCSQSISKTIHMLFSLSKRNQMKKQTYAFDHSCLTKQDHWLAVCCST